VLCCTVTVAGPGMQVASQPLLWGSEEKPCCRMITFSGIPQGHCSHRRQINDPPHSYLYDKELYWCTLQPALISPLSSPPAFLKLHGLPSWGICGWWVAYTGQEKMHKNNRAQFHCHHGAHQLQSQSSKHFSCGTLLFSQCSGIGGNCCNLM